MKRTTGGHCDRKGERVRWKQDLQCTSQFEVVVVAVGLKGWEKRLCLQSDLTGIWSPWLQKRDRRWGLYPHQKLDLWPGLPSKEHQTFISCKCLPSSVWLWSVLPWSGSPSSMPCWIGTFAKDKVMLYLTSIMPICLQKYCFSQHWGNFQLRLCLFPSWQRGPSTVHSTWDSFLKGESHIGYSAVGSPAYFQELHSLKSSFALLMCV